MRVDVFARDINAMIAHHGVTEMTIGNGLPTFNVFVSASSLIQRRGVLAVGAVTVAVRPSIGAARSADRWIPNFTLDTSQRGSEPSRLRDADLCDVVVVAQDPLDAGIAHIDQLGDLKQLHLSRTQVTGACLKHVGRLTNLDGLEACVLIDG